MRIFPLTHFFTFVWHFTPPHAKDTMLCVGSKWKKGAGESLNSRIWFTAFSCIVVQWLMGLLLARQREKMILILRYLLMSSDWNVFPNLPLFVNAYDENREAPGTSLLVSQSAP